MNFETYQLEAQRTCKKEGPKFDLPHMVIGMNSEMNELEAALRSGDEVNILEELSDFQWYFANYCTFRELKFSDYEDKFPADFTKAPVCTQYAAIPFLYTQLSILQDVVKKNMVYNKAINSEEEKLLLNHLQEAVYAVCYGKDRSMHKGLANNIAKLRIRFPEKFTDDLANNRDLDAERKQLEK